MTTQSMYAELYRAISEAKNLSRRRVAQDADLHHSKVIRILDEGGKAEFDVMTQIGKAVGADPVRAHIAVIMLENPGAYFAPNIRIMSELITTLISQFNEIDSNLFEGFINQEVDGLITLTIRTMLAALQKRDRRMNYLQ